MSPLPYVSGATGSPLLADHPVTDYQASRRAGVLDSINEPRDLKRLDANELVTLAQEIREFLVDTVLRTGGHLGPNLGVVELSIAIHRVFDSPTDVILWDTGHQAYVHKLLTGRASGFGRLRQKDGISGYPRRVESVHDVTESSHASAALSYADGVAKALWLRGEHDRKVVAVVGDGALTGGMCWEALNNIGAAPHRPVVVVLNDNGRSYAPTVGALANHLAELRAHDIDGEASLFSQLGFCYLGPIDGHDEPAVEAALRHAQLCGGSAVVHCVTQKGRGYAPAEQHEADRMHAVGAGSSGSSPRPGIASQTWTEVFGDELIKLAARRPEVVAVTAAMLQPVGLAGFAQAYPDRVFDVGIAEQHAVTSAAGLALGGLHPVVAIYATFLNRAVDQTLMDVALLGLGVTFVLDRAGITGEDGPSHNGMWDLSVLQLVPGIRIAAPRDAPTLRSELAEAIATRSGPTAIRFPKAAVGSDIEAVGSIAGMDVLRGPVAPRVLILSVGALASRCVGLADELARTGIAATVIDPRWVCPINPALSELAASYELVVTVEDNTVVGGIGTAVAELLRRAGICTPVREYGIPLGFLQAGTRAEILEELGLTPVALARQVEDELQRQR
ncbi:MAG: 1-deoxy-D-xylulose-5-phosphate synthase [Frankiales bacterium]|nr:1-deoxy-D-xylulose-5-phosphate synthase [Frankiales bacterium]